MKVNLEIDMTPEEARRLMGLPYVTELNDKFVAEMAKRMQAMFEDPEAVMKGWMPLGGQGLEQFQRFLAVARRKDILGAQRLEVVRGEPPLESMVFHHEKAQVESFHKSS